MASTSFFKSSGTTATLSASFAASVESVAASADSAASSASAAATSETNAASSAASALSYKNDSFTNKQNAAASQQSATASENSAATSAATATTQAQSATSSASTASSAVTTTNNVVADATKLALNAANSQFTLSDGSTGFSALHYQTLTAADATSTAADAVSTAADAVSTAADVVTTTADKASALASKNSATTSASSALTSANNASTSETNAASSASSASSAQSAAESARDATLAAYDNFDDRYLGSKSSAPTLDNDGNALVAGALYFNTVAGAMYVYTGSAWVAAYVSGTGFLALTGGTMTGNINFGDNDKAIFGAGSDLQLYHDGSHSRIYDNGGGELKIMSNGTAVRIQKDSGENMILANTDGSVNLYYDSSAKLATTATGIDVTGTVTSDGLTVDGLVGISNSTPSSFFAGARNLVVGSGSGNNGMTIYSGTSNIGNIKFADGTGSDAAKSAGGIRYDHSGGFMRFDTNDGSERLRITSGGAVGIGTSAPTEDLHIKGQDGAHADVIIQAYTGYNSGLNFNDNAGMAGRVYYNHSSNFMAFDTNGSEAARIDSSGAVGIGTSNPNNKVEILHGTVGTGNGSNNTLALRYRSDTLYGQHYMDANGVYIIHADAQGAAGGNLIMSADTTLRFHTGSTPTEAVRIDSSGNLLVGKTDTSTASQGCVLGAGGLTSFNRDNDVVVRVRRDGTDGDGIEFYNDASKVGSISLGASGTTYNTTSDIRLKTDIAPIADATETLMAMNAVSHKWKADPDADAVVGFIAQEMQEIVPEAVSGDADSDEMMSMDYGRITPVLVAALQDAHKKIEQLEQRIAEMENN